MSAPPALDVKNLRVHGFTATFALRAGECVAVQGASGSGKSLLLRALADLDENRGEVRLNGALRESMPAPQWRRKVAYVAAEPGWWAETVREHFRDWPAASLRLLELGLVASCADIQVRRLSTGERQRLGILRAIMAGPQVLLLDEPTSALDPQAAAAVEELIHRERARGMAVLWATHDAGQAMRVASRRLVIDGGELREVGW